MIKKYKKKPVVIEAIQWTGDNTFDVFNFVGYDCLESTKLVIHTLEGKHYASVGDYIIKGISGEYYPCKPDIFEKTYEEVES